MEEQIKKYFNKYVKFTDTEIAKINSKLTMHTFQNKEFIVHEGQICRSKYFILKGLVRSFYINAKGNEKITQFAIENWWVTNLESFVKETPSLISIQALEETTVLSINKTDLEELLISIPKLEKLFRIITENMLIAIQRKNEIYMQMKNKDLYYHFVKNFPNFIQRVPQYMIASYLEMTPEYLSEIRKNKSNSIS